MSEAALKHDVDLEFADQICPCCGDLYEVVRTEEDHEKNICGYIQCPSCGMYTEV